MISFPEITIIGKPEAESRLVVARGKGEVKGQLLKGCGVLIWRDEHVLELVMVFAQHGEPNSTCRITEFYTLKWLKWQILYFVYLILVKVN